MKLMKRRYAEILALDATNLRIPPAPRDTQRLVQSYLTLKDLVKEQQALIAALDGG